MVPHTLAVYRRDDALFVQPSLPTRRGLVGLATVLRVERRGSGLDDALGEAERVALLEGGKSPSKRQWGDDRTLAAAAGCDTFVAFIHGTVECTLVRTPDSAGDSFSMRD